VKKLTRKILIASHASGTPGGPVEKLQSYLSKKNIVYTIKHPLYPKSSTKSEIYFNKKRFIFKLPFFIQYPLEGIITTFILLKHRTPIDLAVCFDPLSFFNVYFFNFFYNVKKIIYYNLDYSITRFNNPFLNNIYHFLNRFAYEHCSYLFILRESILDKIDPGKKFRSKNFIVGQTVSSIRTRGKKNIKNNSILYAGAIGNSVDFKPLITALVKLKKNKIFFNMDIFGKENDKGKLRKMILINKLEKNVFFKGPAEVNELTKKIIPNYKIGVSPYMLKKDKKSPDYLYQGSLIAAKVVDYIAGGLPVIATRVNPAFDDIEKYQFGFNAKTENDWFIAIKSLLTDQNLYKKYQKNALKFAKKFDENIVFGPIFKKILEEN